MLKAELAYIRRRRFGQGPPRYVKHTLVGLALSGGGLRSVTTNLGILQTLSLGILQRVDGAIPAECRYRAMLGSVASANAM